MNRQPTESTSLSAQLKFLVDDLLEHRVWIYWADLLTSMLLFWSGALGSLDQVITPWLRMACFIVAVLALYRAATFMHEIVHFPKAVLRSFRWTWNLVCGIPILLPSFLYSSHLNHHATPFYATVRDPEYLAFGSHPVKSWGTLLIGTVISPFVLAFRFAILVPLASLMPALRRWLNVHMSAVAIHAHFRDTATEHTRRRAERRIVEPLTTAYVWLVMIAYVTGYLSLRVIVTFVACALCVLLLNAIRTRYAHRYAYDNESVSSHAQIEDSATLDYGAWFAVFAPVGLRYHALHHLFPHLPYHALRTAHDRIVRSPVPAAEVYRHTCRRHRHKSPVFVLSDGR